jgi:hypothetical protein
LSSKPYRNHGAAHAMRDSLQKPLAWPRYGITTVVGVATYIKEASESKVTLFT